MFEAHTTVWSKLSWILRPEAHSISRDPADAAAAADDDDDDAI